MNTAYTSSATPASVVAQIAGLSDLPMAEIKRIWDRLFRAEVPTHNRQFLERRIAYKLQEVEFRKDDKNLIERNQRRITALVEKGKLSKRDRDVRPVAGTVLSREYQGVIYQVSVTADSQYQFDGRLYPSLSVIAREITGTRWSGPLFFGLKVQAPAKKKGTRT